jgi:hypothetical protein
MLHCASADVSGRVFVRVDVFVYVDGDAYESALSQYEL